MPSVVTSVQFDEAVVFAGTRTDRARFDGAL